MIEEDDNEILSLINLKESREKTKVEKSKILVRWKGTATNGNPMLKLHMLIDRKMDMMCRKMDTMLKWQSNVKLAFAVEQVANTFIRIILPFFFLPQ